jgi:RNA polymerase sigma-70 factor (ECF subfamily)
MNPYDPLRGSFTTWIYRITVNLCRNQQRRQRPYLSLERAHAHGMDVATTASLPLDEMLFDENQNTVFAAVQRLPSKLREAVILRYYGELSYQEVAQVLQCPIGTVRSRLAAAHTRLSRELGEK